jgi:Cytochrome C oxidase, cbb3-type, subunit III
MAMVWMAWLACTARPPTAARGIELEDPQEEAKRAAAQAASTNPDAGLIAAATDPPAAYPEHDSSFVYSRERMNEQARAVAQLPIHINESWWPFRAQRFGITPAQAQKRDAQLSQVRAPADFWDSQTALEAVSVWTVLCNECHGGRRSLEDAMEMPAPAPAWGSGEGLFFGNRRTYKQMFNVVQNGGPVRESGRAEMPAWRNVLSTEMIWSLLYFLEYQSGGIESRFPPSLFPRRPKLLGKQLPGKP